MLCRRCEHDNPEQNRYCGMCGSRLEMPAESANEASTPQYEGNSKRAVSSSSSSILGLDSEPVRGQPFQREPSIAGPSFLGIGAEPERQANKYSYLFEYDEPRSHRGLWITLVLLATIALVGLQFRRELRARAYPLYTYLMARVNPQPPAPPVPAATPGPADSTAPPPQATPPVTSEASPGTGVTPDAVSQPSGSTVSQPKPEDSATAASADQKSDTPESAKSDEPVENPAPTKASRQPRKAAYAKRERLTQPDAGSPEDNRLLQLAQKYIHGRGGHADCTTGLAYLREATKHPNSAAASQMGALYATGTCVPLDRVAAYRWFSSALQMTPNNPWLVRERDQLYAQMSGAERRLADRQ